MPHVLESLDLAQYISADAGSKGYRGNMDAYAVTLLTIWWGNAATADSEFCFDYLLRLTSDHSNYDTVSKKLADGGAHRQGQLHRQPGDAAVEPRDDGIAYSAKWHAAQYFVTKITVNRLRFIRQIAWEVSRGKYQIPTINRT